MLLMGSASFAEDIVPATSEVVSGTDYYLYNKEYKGFLVGANDWGTRASVDRNKGLKITVTKLESGLYKLGAMSPDNADGIWIDGSRAGNDQFTLTSLSENNYFNIGNTKFPGTIISWTGDENNTRVNFVANGEYGTWGAVTQTAYDAYFAAIAAAEETQGIYSSRMSNDKAKWAGASGVYGGGVEKYVEAGVPAGDVLSQTIENLPSGKYEVKFNAIANVARNLDAATWAGEGKAQAFANGDTVAVTIGTKAALDADDWTNGVVTLNCEVGEDGTLKYGMSNLVAAGQWYVAKAISLIRTGDLDAAGWDGETVTTSLGETAVLKLSDLDNLVLTLPGAKSIEILDEEDCQYMVLQNENGSEMYGLWAPTMGSTYTIEGSTITLGGFMTMEGATVAIPVGTSKLYIEDYGTLKVDGEEAYLPTIELNAEIAELGPQPFMLTSVSNNGVEGNLIQAVEAAETGVSCLFQVIADGKKLAVGTGAPTLTLMENASADFGQASLSVNESIGLIAFLDPEEMQYFTEPGTYVLSIPEGTFVDEEGAPNAAATLKWVIIQNENKEITITEENVTVGSMVDNSWGTNDVYYTATVKFAKPEGAKYAYSEGLHLELNGENTGVPFQFGQWGLIELGEGDEITLVYKDNMIAKTDDPEYEGDLRPAGTYSAYTEITFMDENQWELEGVVAKFEGTIVLPKFPELAEGEYYIQNVKSGLYLAGNNSWSTQASVVTAGEKFAVTLSEGNYIITNTYLTCANKTLGYNLYVDTNVSQNGNLWQIEKAEGVDGAFTIYGKGKKDNVADAFEGYIAQSETAGAVAGFVLEGVAEVNEAALWRFVTEAEMLANIKAGDNVSSLIVNPGFARYRTTDAWIVDEGCTNKNLGGGENNNYCAESYHSVFNIHQTLKNLPNGTYTMTAQGFYRQDGEDVENLPVFYANEETTVFPLKTGEENSMANASASFTQGLYTIEPISVVVTDGTLTVGVKSNNATMWCIWDNFQLTYLGEVSVPLEETDLTKAMFMQYYSETTGEALETPATIGCDYNVGVSNSMIYGLSTVKWYAYADVTAYDKLALFVTEGTPRVMYNRDMKPGAPGEDGVNHVEITTESPFLTVEDWGAGLKVYLYDLKAMAAADPAKPYVHINAIKGFNFAPTTITKMVLNPSEETLAIEGIQAEAEGNVMFNLNGQRVSNAKGLVIMNGKKVIIK